MRKIVSIFCVCALIVSAAVGCRQQTDGSTDYSNTSLTGKVTAIENTTVILQLGELTEMNHAIPEMGSGAGEIGQMPGLSNDADGFGQLPENNGGENTPPEIPFGTTGEIPPEIPSDEQGGGIEGTLSGLPDAERGNMPEGAAPPEMPDTRGGMGFGGSMSAFTASEETVTIDLGSADITVESMEGTADVSVSDISTGDILVIEVGDKNTVTSVTVKFIPDFGGQTEHHGGSLDGSVQPMPPVS